MAKGESIADLYLRLGLSYDELNQDFINVENTLNSELARINQQSSIINLKAAIDLASVTDAEQKLAVEQQKLIQQIDLQTQKLKLLETAWKGAIDKNGEASRQALNAEKAYRQQELAVKRLEQQLKALSNQQNNSSSNSNFLVSGYNVLKGHIPESIGNLANEFSKLKEVSGIADGAITKLLESVGSIPAPVAVAVAAIAAIPVAVKAIENGLIDLARPAIEAGDAFYVMSRGMQVSIADAEKLSTICKVTGIDISEVNNSMRRFSTQLNKAGDNNSPMLKMLERFGAQVRDSNGRIKDEIGLIQELSKAWKNALDAGESAKFRDVVGGKFWSGDFITFLEDYQDNVAAAANIVRNGLFDPVKAHSVQGQINAMNAQAEQLGSAFSSALMPVAEQIVPHLTERMGELTKVIADNAEGIKNVGFAVGEVVDSVSSLSTEIVKLAAVSTNLMIRTPTSAIVDKYKNDYTIKNARELTDKILQDNYSDSERFVIQTSPQRYSALIKQNEEAFQSIKKFRESIVQTQKSWADFRNEIDTKFDISALSEESSKRVEKFADELERLKIDLSDKDDFQKSLDKLDLQYKKELELAKDFEKEKTILAELDEARREQIELAHNEKINQMRQDSEQRTRDLLQNAANIQFGWNSSPFEQQIQAIKQWEQKSIDSLQKYKDALKDTGQYEQELAAITANSLAKQADAFQQEIDRIRGKVQSLAEKIFEQEHSQRDIDLMRIQKQRADYLKEDIYPKEMIDRWFQGELAKIQERITKDTSGDYSRTPNRQRQDVSNFPVMYGNLPDIAQLPAKDFFADIQNETSSVVDNFIGLTDSTKSLTDAQNSLAEGFKLIEGDKIVADFSNSVQGIIDAQGYLTDSVTHEGDNLARALQELAQNIKNTPFAPPSLTNKQDDSSFDYSSAKTAADIVGTIGEAVALAGGVSLNPLVAAGGGVIALAGNTASKTFEKMDDSAPSANYTIPNFDNSEVINAINNIKDKTSELLSGLSQHTLDISHNVQAISQRQPNITVSPNINIDLGGAYVFDNAMRMQLVDDITNDVVDAVKSAVQNEVTNASYSYSN